MKIKSLTEASKEWKTRNTIKMGIRVGYSPINNQLLILLEKLETFKEIEIFALTKEEEVKNKIDWYKKEFSGKTIITYNQSENYLLGLLNIAFLPESNFDVYLEYPNSTIKIGLPHGEDIPIHKTIMDYGGGFMFDYILSPTIISDKDGINKYEDIYHRSIINHSRNYICQIPFGFPELDKFINETTKSQKLGLNSIVYHIALLSVERRETIEIIEPTLKILLSKFTDKRIIFRPYKYDYNNEVIKRCIEIGSKYKNFYLSTEESYIKDYSTALAMVCHRDYKSHPFSLATGQPIFLCYPDKTPIISRDPTMEACPLSSLESKLRSYIEKNHIISTDQRIKHCKKLGLNNPGNSVEYLIENIDFIIKNKTHPGWKYFNLESENHIKEINNYIAIQVISSKEANITLNMALGKFPERSEILLFIADSYSRKKFLSNYYSKISLKCFYKLIKNINLTAEVKEIAEGWWKSIGQDLIKNIYNDKIEQPTKSIEIADDIDEDFLPNLLLATEGFHAIKNKPFTELKTLINLETIEPKIYNGEEIIIYGGRNLARQFLDKNKNLLKIKAIVDPDLLYIGTELQGIEVQHVDIIKECEAPILICSYTYLLESLIKIRSLVGSKRQLFAICKDQQIFSFLKVLQNK